jgi:CBS domain containing-hemolysin-like protein
MSDTIFHLFLIGFLLFANGFFVASEFAMVKIRRTRIEQLSKEGNTSAQIALEAVKDLDRFIAAVQLGITISSIGLGWVGENTLAGIFTPLFAFLPVGGGVAAHTIAVPLAFALITIMHVVIGELIPKSIALEYTETTALLVARPMRVITKIFSPFIKLLNGLGNLILKLFRVPHTHKYALVHSPEELNMLVTDSYNEGVLNETEKDMLQNVFKFSDLTAKQVMVPRTDMVCVPQEMTFEELNQLAAENQYTRYPVYDDNIDHITGFVHVKDLYLQLLQHKNRGVETIQRDIMLVPETITMDNLIMDFKKNKAQMAVVIDEFGGTSGLITVEDVLEEIFGDVQDEFDVEEEFNIKETAPNTYIANAMMRIDEFAEFFDLDEEDIDDEDIDTLGGLVVKLLGRLAQVGDTAVYKNFYFVVKEIDGARIKSLEIVRSGECEVCEGEFI